MPLERINCGEASEAMKGTNVLLYGWCRYIRDHGGKLFIDIADRYGTTQLVFEGELLDYASSFGREYVIMAAGEVAPRNEDTVDSSNKTGKVEIRVKEVKLINKSKTPPFELIEEKEKFLANEETRLQYRYLDLRRANMAKNIVLRSEVTKTIRQFFWDKGFLELETPTLIKDTYDTGARTFVIPSRISKGKFYSLPQSPQFYKQLCMIAGLDRYFQIAKCYRDEDPREDRQPEFTQVDIEASFVNEDDIQGIMEEMMVKLFKNVLGKDIVTPFRRMEFAQAFENYGSDKPDMRFSNRIIDISDIAGNSDYNILKRIVANSGKVRMLSFHAEYGSSKKITEKYMLKIIELAKSYGLQGLTWLYVKDGKLRSEPESIANVFKPIEAGILSRMEPKLKDGDIIIIGGDLSDSILLSALGKLRNVIGNDVGEYDEDYAFIWIIDFPMFERDEITGKLKPSHNPVTLPQDTSDEAFAKNPESIKSRQYDLVLNGYELGSGSIRITDPGLQRKVLKSIGIGETEIERDFGFFLEALSYGTPSHGGMALGLDRLVALMAGTPNIRDFILFPKNKRFESPMDGSPSEINGKRLSGDFGISIK